MKSYKKAADDVLAKEPDENKWTSAQIKIVVRLLKRKGDAAIGKTKKELLEQYNKYKSRLPMTTADDVDMIEVAVHHEEDNHDEEMESGGGNGVMDLS